MYTKNWFYKFKCHIYEKLVLIGNIFFEVCGFLGWNIIQLFIHFPSSPWSLIIDEMRPFVPVD